MISATRRLRPHLAHVSNGGFRSPLEKQGMIVNHRPTAGCRQAHSSLQTVECLRLLYLAASGAPQIVGGHCHGQSCGTFLWLLYSSCSLIIIILFFFLLIINTLTNNYYGGELYTCAPFPLPYCCAWRGGSRIIVLRRTMGTAPFLPLLYF